MPDRPTRVSVDDQPVTEAHRLLVCLDDATTTEGARNDTCYRSSVVSAEALFGMLEGRRVDVCQRSWRLRVYGILDQNGIRWLQLLLEGQPEYTVTVRTSPDQSVDHTIRVLSGWLADPSAEHQLLSVA